MVLVKTKTTEAQPGCHVLTKSTEKNSFTYPRDYGTRSRQLGLQVVISSSLIELCTLLKELRYLCVIIVGWMPSKPGTRSHS